MTPRPVLRPTPIESAAHAGALLSDGLNRDVLRELLASGPLPRGALTARLHARATRIYERLRSLQDTGLIEADARHRPPSYAITDSGRSLVEVAGLIESWFAARPLGRPASSVGWRAFSDLAEAWRAGLIEFVVRLAPTEEDLRGDHRGRGAPEALESLAAMVEAGMVETYERGGEAARHRLTPWAARAIGPLSALARWEARHRPPEGSAIVREDALVAFLAGLRLVHAADLSGLCMLSAVEDSSRPGRSVGAWARFAEGALVDLGEGAPRAPAEGWASGSFEAWIEAVLDGDARRLHVDGRGPSGTRLARVVVGELHRQLAGQRSDPEV